MEIELFYPQPEKGGGGGDNGTAQQDNASQETNASQGTGSASNGDNPQGGKKMKPASAYDYSKNEIPGKFEDDWDYIKNGEGGNMFTRWLKTLKRDFDAPGNLAAQDIQEVTELGAAIPVIRIGKFVVGEELFHRVIKQRILKAAGNFNKIGGTNPDIVIRNGKIFLQGAKYGPFIGNSYDTGLDPTKFFK